MRRLVLFLVSLIAVEGCAAPGPGGSSDALTGACQVRKCVCGPAGWSPFMASGSVPVRWRENGDAYCPEGYELHPVEPSPTIDDDFIPFPGDQPRFRRSGEFSAASISPRRRLTKTP